MSRKIDPRERAAAERAEREQSALLERLGRVAKHEAAYMLGRITGPVMEVCNVWPATTQKSRTRLVAGMIQLRRALGLNQERLATVPGALEPDRKPARTIAELHDALDTLLALYLQDNHTKLPSTTSVLQLVQWSDAQVKKAAASG